MTRRTVLAIVSLTLTLVAGTLGTVAAQDQGTAPGVHCDGPHMMGMVENEEMAAIHAQLHGTAEGYHQHMTMGQHDSVGAHHMDMHSTTDAGAGDHMPMHGMDTSGGGYRHAGTMGGWCG